MEIFQYNKNQEGMIFETIIGSSKDGPGLRYVIYLKGCNFSCPWCSNPEGLSKKKELLLFPEKEKFTSKVLNSCPYSAIKLNSRGSSVTNRKICEKCKTFDCVNVCYDSSRIKVGEVIKVEEIVSNILKYKRFFGKEGGVTLTGGEPTIQWEFMFELMKYLNQCNIHVALETNGASANLVEIFPYINLIICDLKMINPEKHQYWTGFSNEQVLKNIEMMYKSKVPFWIRVPIIPSINDSEENLKETREFLAPMRDFLKLELIPYHQAGLKKWKGLAKEYSLPNIKPPSYDDMLRYKRYFSDANIMVIST